YLPSASSTCVARPSTRHQLPHCCRDRLGFYWPHDTIQKCTCLALDQYVGNLRYLAISLPGGYMWSKLSSAISLALDATDLPDQPVIDNPIPRSPATASSIFQAPNSTSRQIIQTWT